MWESKKQKRQNRGQEQGTEMYRGVKVSVHPGASLLFGPSMR